MMRGAGIGKRGVYGRAKEQAAKVDLFTYRTDLFNERTSGVHSQNTPVQPLNIPVQRENTPVQRENTPLSEEWTSLGWVEEPVTILSRCAEADRMPDGGNKMQPSSPFASRRRAQVQ